MGTDLVESGSFYSETTAKVWIKEVAAEEIKMMDTAPVVRQGLLQQPVRDRDDDWFLLLDVVSRKMSFVPPGINPLHMFSKQAFLIFV